MNTLNFETPMASTAEPLAIKDSEVIAPTKNDLKAVLGEIDLSVVATSVCACGCSCHVDNE